MVGPFAEAFGAQAATVKVGRGPLSCGRCVPAVDRVVWRRARAGWAPPRGATRRGVVVVLRAAVTAAMGRCHLRLCV